MRRVVRLQVTLLEFDEDHARSYNELVGPIPLTTAPSLCSAPFPRPSHPTSSAASDVRVEWPPHAHAAHPAAGVCAFWLWCRSPPWLRQQ